MAQPCTILTAIPYVNSTPHIGNVLTTLAGDITARYHRMLGEDVFYCAGTDENGLKIKEAAEQSGEDVGKFVDRIAGRFVDIFAGLNLSYDVFIRTSQPNHAKTAQEVFRVLQKNGFIYTGTYEGWYDVSTETYFKEGELVDGKSPDGNDVRWISEQNYFFKLSAFEARLLEAIESGQMKIVPESRQNEVLSFIKQGLRDACISRSNPGWGIPVPGDDKQVIYVWFDALINYITAVGWPNTGWEQKWPPIVQWLGKDILTRFHATLWPAMLMGIDAPLPKTIAAHGWITLGGEKISKSRGNVVEPLDLRDQLAAKSGCTSLIAVDAIRYFVTATMPFEGDTMFSYEEFDKRYNTDLANDLGNALNRSLAMSHLYVGGIVPDVPIEPEVSEAIARVKEATSVAMDEFRFDRAVNEAWEIVRFVNKYIDTRAPWALSKAADPALSSVLRSMLLCLRTAEALLRPVMPTAADEIARQLGVDPLTTWAQIGDIATLPSGTKLLKPQPIFPRIDQRTKVMEAPAKQEPVAKPTQEATLISIDEFAKIQLKVARILEAEPLEGSDKLMKLQVMVGDEKRQIVAGIRSAYQPMDLIGRQVIVVANLKPAMLRGTESQGMLLAATDDSGQAILLQPERDAPEGARVK